MSDYRRPMTARSRDPEPTEAAPKTAADESS